MDSRSIFKHFIVAGIRGLMEDPCHVGLPEMLTVAHVAFWTRTLRGRGARKWLTTRGLSPLSCVT